MATSGADLVAYAKQFIGTPYVWGGNSLKNGVDCSGFIQQVFKNFGIGLTRTTYTQVGEGKAVKQNELVAGDVIFFDNQPGGGPDHVGIYIGDGKMIHAPRPGKGVEISDMTTGYWQSSYMGARRMAGIKGGDVAGDWDPSGKQAPVRLSKEEMAAEYGWSYAFMNSQPELKKLFKSYVDDNWSKEKFQAEVRNTKWWKENSQSAKAAANEKFSDPATYNAKVAAAKVQVQQLAGEMGAIIPSKKVGKIAEQIVTTNLDEGGIRNVLGGYIKFIDKGTLSGQAGMFEHAIKEYAYQQGVEINKETVQHQAQLLGRGIATEQDFKSQVMQQAISTFPSYKAQLEAGQTMMDIASPYIQQIAEDLQIPYQQIGLNDPMVRSALNGQNAQGKPVGMDLVSFRKMLRSDPRWKETDTARNDTMSAGYKVLKDMGLVGG